MNKHSALRTSGSLLERAAEIYDFKAPTPQADRTEPVRTEPQRITAPTVPVPPVQPVAFAAAETPRAEPAKPSIAAPLSPAPRGRAGSIDRSGLRDAGFILPDAPVSGLAEEFRIIKRQLLLGVDGRTGLPDEKRQTILVCSAQPDEGKTFCSVNLALSLASETDVEVLLIDGDFAKPEILSILGLEAGAGLIDALADPSIDPDSLVIRTDVEGLSVLPAGRQENNVTELLAADRTRDVLSALTVRHPKRVVIFDSPPALVASPASVLATHVGQVVMVVRADSTSEADLREAIALLSGCESISLMLNGTGVTATGRRFGSYYGYGQ
jgi:protein-tyrosine kinase